MGEKYLMDDEDIVSRTCDFRGAEEDYDGERRKLETRFLI